MAYETILVDVEDHVALITLDRPEALNALNSQLLGELGQALAAADKDKNVRSIIITGSEKAFAAGADIKAIHDTRWQMLQSTTFRQKEAAQSPALTRAR